MSNVKSPMHAMLPQEMLKKLREHMHEYGLRHTLERSGLWITQRFLAPALRRHSRPPLSAFEEAAASMHFSADELAANYFYPDICLEERAVILAAIQREFEDLRGEITGRYAHLQGIYPVRYAVEEGSSFLLYALVRSLRPNTVLETGVANGHSSFYILSAMRANGHGLLHSVDRSEHVGSLLAERERERWRLHVLRATDLKKSFRQVLNELPPLDLFLHDSDHSFAWTSFELNTAIEKLAPGAVLASDDCDSCFAFIDACHRLAVRPAFLVEARKVFGFAFPISRASFGSKASTIHLGRAATRHSA